MINGGHFHAVPGIRITPHRVPLCNQHSQRVRNEKTCYLTVTSCTRYPPPLLQRTRPRPSPGIQPFYALLSATPGGRSRAPYPNNGRRILLKRVNDCRTRCRQNSQQVQFLAREIHRTSFQVKSLPAQELKSLPAQEPGNRNVGMSCVLLMRAFVCWVRREQKVRKFVSLTLSFTRRCRGTFPPAGVRVSSSPKRAE